ncbi:hypothetical protein Tco_0667241 [Tanacetum coccineum]
MRVKHHEKHIESILNYLEELSFHYIEKIEERLVNGWMIIPRDFDEVKTKLKEARTQILELQKKHMGQRDKIAFVHFRISDLEMTLEDIQDRHQLYMKNLMGHTSLRDEAVTFISYTFAINQISPVKSCLPPLILLAFPSANILDYTLTLPNYFPARPGNNSSDFLENSKNDEIPPIFSHFYNNPYLKDMQAFNAKESPIPPLDHITPPAILTPSLVLPQSLLFDPRYCFVPEELLPPKKQIHPPSSFSTTISNSSQKQACILVPLSFLTYTPTPPQIYKLGKSSIKMRVKHHEKQIESILNYLEELSFHYIEKIEERLVNGWIIIPRDFDEVKTKLKEACTQIVERKKESNETKRQYYFYSL